MRSMVEGAAIRTLRLWGEVRQSYHGTMTESPQTTFALTPDAALAFLADHARSLTASDTRVALGLAQHGQVGQVAVAEDVPHGRSAEEQPAFTARLDEGDDLVQAVDLRVEPLADLVQGETLYLVLFTPQGAPQSRTEAAQRTLEQQEGVVEALERELREARERLQSMVEEYETSLEELKSANEELVSVNEEAQSSNEELEASKEEMQSLNEELNTINAELSVKVEALDRAVGRQLR